MAELTKQWNDGGLLTVAYDGEGDGSATFSSEVAEGLDREMSISVADTSRSVIVERTVRQIGMREVFRCSDGDFILADGGTFNVLKAEHAGGEPVETYTQLTYIETDGQQYIDTGYVVKETDTIEMDFALTLVSSADKFLFGTVGASTGLWFSHYANTAYIRFGQKSSTTWSQVTTKTTLRLKKGNIWMGSNKTLAFVEMPDNTLYLFAEHAYNGGLYGYGYCQCKRFAIVNGDTTVMELLPYKRDSDGAIGLLDTVSNKFYVSDSGVSFIAGEIVS